LLELHFTVFVFDVDNIQKQYVEMDAGMDDYHSKPILFETLQAAIDR